MLDCYAITNDILKQAVYGIDTVGIINQNTDKTIKTLKHYLSILVESKLLDYDKSSARYQTTSNGRRFLYIHNILNSLLQ